MRRATATYAFWFIPTSTGNRSLPPSIGPNNMFQTPTARLAPGQRRQRRNDRPHVFRIDNDVAERRLHAPQPEQSVAVDAVVFFQTIEQAGILDRKSTRLNSSHLGI